jgi:hypothetical protein
VAVILRCIQGRLRIRNWRTAELKHISTRMKVGYRIMTDAPEVKHKRIAGAGAGQRLVWLACNDRLALRRQGIVHDRETAGRRRVDDVGAAIVVVRNGPAGGRQITGYFESLGLVVVGYCQRRRIGFAVLAADAGDSRRGVGVEAKEIEQIAASDNPGDLAGEALGIVQKQRASAARERDSLGIRTGNFQRHIRADVRAGIAAVANMHQEIRHGRRTIKQVGDREYLKVFASEGAAETWFEQHDPEGVAFEYDVKQ